MLSVSLKLEDVLLELLEDVLRTSEDAQPLGVFGAMSGLDVVGVGVTVLPPPPELPGTVKVKENVWLSALVE